MRVAVVGAGVSGLAAARALAGEHDVVVLDKGRSVGGRLATRRIGEATLDHGAQFFTARGDAFRSQVDDWLKRGVARVWCHGFRGRVDGHPRYIGTAGMNSLAKDLAAGLDHRTESMVFSIRRSGDRWDVVVDDGSMIAADAVVLTCPLPQTFSITIEAGVEMPEPMMAGEYERTLCVLAVLDRPSTVPDPGGLQFAGDDAHGVLNFVADNLAKGISRIPAITAHATPAWSAAHWDDEPDDIIGELLDHLRPWMGASAVTATQLKRWRFATPTAIWPDPCWVDASGRLVVAGDAFDGPKIEGAFMSGLAAATALQQS